MQPNHPGATQLPLDNGRVLFHKILPVMHEIKLWFPQTIYEVHAPQDENKAGPTPDCHRSGANLPDFHTMRLLLICEIDRTLDQENFPD